jgi:hypothetical protein
MSRLPGGRVNSIAELLTGDALYLFYCGVQRRKCGDTDAGGEVVRALRSEDPGLSVVAAAMLSNAGDRGLMSTASSQLTNDVIDRRFGVSKQHQRLF